LRERENQHLDFSLKNMASYLHVMPVLTAAIQDIPQLVALINSAYRGDASKKGWTTEADLLKGEKRTNAETIEQLMESEGAVFLKYVNKQNEIEGCVFLDKKGNKLYLGMLSVSPKLQAKGTGKQLMNAAVLYAKQHGCDDIFMRVISVRHELIKWYEKQGYYKTGQTEPFPNDNRFGIPTRPLEFLVMEKKI
jgi:ribosomal protein S18 acetylase RimI-like enzyme